MIRLSNYTGWSLAIYLFACGDSLSLTKLVPLGLFTAALLWFGHEVHDAYASEVEDAYHDAPIGSQVARDLNIEVPNA